MTDRATGSDVTLQGFPRVHACTTRSWGFRPLFFGCFSLQLNGTLLLKINTTCGICLDSLLMFMVGQFFFNKQEMRTAIGGVMFSMLAVECGVKHNIKE